MARRSEGFISGLGSPVRAAMVMSRAIFVNACPFLASVAAFLCLMDDHLE